MRILDPRTVAFFRHFGGAYPGRTLLMVSLLVVSGLLEGISVVTLVPLLDAAASDGVNPASGGLVGAIGSMLLGIGIDPTIGALVGVVVVGMTLKAGILWLAMRQVGFTVARVTMDLRLQLVRALLKARWSYFGGQPVGRYANTVSSEAIRSASAYQEACIFLAGLVQVAVYLVIAALISWQVSAVALLTGAVLVVMLKRFRSMSRSAGEQQTTLTKSLATRLVDALQGIKPMKAMGREDLFWPLLEGEARGLNEAHRRFIVASESLRMVQEPVVTLVLGVGLVALLTFTDQAFSGIVVLAFVFYRIMTHINTLQMRYSIMVAAESAFWSIREQIEDARAAVEQHPGTTVPDDLTQGIALRGVHFAYGDLQVLDQLYMQVPAGAVTALIGQSGSGKTTIVDLVAGLQRPQSGEVFIDGVPLAEIDLHAWRGMIGYVPQHVFLFNDTVRRNITLGDDSIPDERIVQALKDAGAWDFIARDPLGLDAVIAPQGSNFSGGQKQRLAIARALVKQPTLMILDEATTGLDTATEAAILETLQELRGRVTVLAISHQPALRDIADVTIELVDGRIADTVDASAAVEVTAR